MSLVVRPSKRKLPQIAEHLSYEARRSANHEVIEKIRDCALARIGQLQKSHRANFLQMRLIHFILTQSIFFDFPKGIDETMTGAKLPFNHPRVIEAIVKHGLKPSSEDFDLTLKQQKFFVAYCLKEDGGFSLSARQKEAFDIQNVAKLKEYLQENTKLRVEKEDLPKAMNRYFYFQKASKECLTVFFNTLPNGRQLLQDCLEALPLQQDTGGEQQLRQKLSGIRL